MASAEGVEAASLPASYPAGVEKSETRRRGARWFTAGLEGVVCRSASLARLGLAEWTQDHQPWGEIAIFVTNSVEEPRIIDRRDELDWLYSG